MLPLCSFGGGNGSGGLERVVYIVVGVHSVCPYDVRLRVKVGGEEPNPLIASTCINCIVPAWQ